MRHSRYFISLYLIIPLIFSGLVALSAILLFRITEYHIQQGLDMDLPVFWAVTGCAGVTFVVGMLVVRFFLRPMDRFAKAANQLPVISEIKEKTETKSSQDDELHVYTSILETVTDVLSRVDARKFFPEITGESRAMRGVLGQILKVSPTGSTVMILGESGTGKELVATSIHDHSQRKGMPFIAINCAAIPPELLESELFGHERGAFTGATARKIGKFELANRGTIFLDEIGDLPLDLQGKLLRVLQEQEVDRLGGNQPVKVDLRIIAATNKNLQKMVAAGTFREDLYYRLNVVPLFLPPLRERLEDIPLLVELFLQSKSALPTKVDDTAMQMLMRYSWPGNIRELENTIEAAGVMSGGEDILPRHLPAHIVQNQALAKQATLKKYPLETITDMDMGLSLDQELEKVEIRLIEKALGQTKGIQVKAAELLRINQRSLWHRIKKYKIHVEEFKG